MPASPVALADEWQPNLEGCAAPNDALARAVALLTSRRSLGGDAPRNALARAVALLMSTWTGSDTREDALAKAVALLTGPRLTRRHARDRVPLGTTRSLRRSRY